MLYFKIRWQPRGDGSVRLPTYYRYEQLEEKIPLLLLRYFKNNAVLYENNSQRDRPATATNGHAPSQGASTTPKIEGKAEGKMEGKLEGKAEIGSQNSSNP